MISLSANRNKLEIVPRENQKGLEREKKIENDKVRGKSKRRKTKHDHDHQIVHRRSEIAAKLVRRNWR
jgi:hypothetical protein